jgi:hypothetical protein
MKCAAVAPPHHPPPLVTPCQCCCSLRNMLLAGLSHSHKRVKGSALALLTACLLVSTSTMETACQELLPLVIDLVSVASTTMSGDMETVIDILGSRLPADTFAVALLPSFEVCSHASCMRVVSTILPIHEQ